MAIRTCICSLLLAFCATAVADAGAAADVVQWSSYTVDHSQPSAGGLAYTTQVSLSSDALQEYGSSFRQLSVEVTPETAHRLRVRIQPVGQQRWEVPESIVPRPGPQPGLSSSQLTYDVLDLAQGQPFALHVIRKADGSAIFDTTGHRFLFKDQYIQLTTALPADADVYGLGEFTNPAGLMMPRDGRTLALWARDISSANEYANLYGVHPFYVQTNKDGSSHGVLLLNSNGMDVAADATALTYKVIGGLVDLYFFTGPSPEEVVRQYHQVIGRPALPPYWSLGLHQSKWGYPNLEYVQDVVANHSAAGLPLETIWSDIDYMHNRFRNAEFDPHRYPAHAMSSFVEALHSRGQHWIPILDAGVAVSNGYSAYEEGNKDSIWIKDYTGKETFVGQVWPGPSVYPDYMSSAAVGPWLQRKIDRFHKQVPWSGLWLDMNEASNFCSGMNCKPDVAVASNMHWLEMQVPKDGNISELYKMLSTCVMKCEQPAASNSLAFPPYAIHNYKGPGQPRTAPLSSNVISPTAKHADGSLEYDAHNLYGAAMAKSHYEAAVEVTGKRPFLVSRSTFPGAGRYTAHWTGDNAGNWENLFYSIAGVINSNIWGMPMVGADICGFIDATQDGDPWQNENRLPEAEYEQLCNRWAQAGAFYTFSRNHMGYPARHHEFYRWPSVAAAARKAYGLRYQLLTYMYSSLFLAHSKGGTVLRPLFFAAPRDAGARSAEAQWMVGEALLVSPVITPDTSSISPYFTAGAWYSAWDYSPLVVEGPAGQAVELEVPVGDIAVHYRGGTVVPLQQPALVTRDVRVSPVTLVVALPSSTAAEDAAAGGVAPYAAEEFCRGFRQQHADRLVSCGMLFMDGEADAPEVTAENSVQVLFTAVAAADARTGSISSSVVSNSGEAAGTLRVSSVHVLGVGSGAAGAAVRVNAEEVLAADVSFDGVSGVLKVSGLQLAVGQAFDLHWSA
ncbi:glycosyl hydrolases family 31-domain-containing protein [Scenedesmus sp. NREL 46B-D3]|nr:glycosyl hydrolases family 31-domain-containing protein [Scenedesmus sp. NREL 46B-D3]